MYLYGSSAVDLAGLSQMHSGLVVVDDEDGAKAIKKFHGETCLRMILEPGGHIRY
jgi:hypothetical protein